MPLRAYCFAIAGCKLIIRLSLTCFEKVIHMEISRFDKSENSSGAICARLSADAERYRGGCIRLFGSNCCNCHCWFSYWFPSKLAIDELSIKLLFMLPLVGLNVCFHIKSFVGFQANSKVTK